ncbi:hypothetical protein, partial [Erwinia amylovora]|uniref:hypothetical protein n=1 Tax=Erwinia amylovora TaxID=552 RepID=UPI0020BE94F5
MPGLTPQLRYLLQGLIFLLFTTATLTAAPDVSLPAAMVGASQTQPAPSARQQPDLAEKTAAWN